MKIIVEPTEFRISALATRNDGTTETLELNVFNQYVTRGFEIPENLSIGAITTGIVFDQDYNYGQAPTRIYIKNGKIFAEINSLTNSIYSVISNPVTVNSVKGHWSESIVNDMASRLIIKNPEMFMPNQEITRAEFVEYIIKALGIYRTGATNTHKFSDVETGNDLADAIQIAAEYGITSGYSDGSFKPGAKISREEAMVMFSKAMDIAGLEEVYNDRIESYMDKDIVAKWAYNDVEKNISAGVFNGKTKNTIDPKGTFTFAEAATAIKNLLVASELINE